MTSTVLPMFPLGTVLFPSLSIPLHVFEPRYRALARHCTSGDGQLGIVLIERGSEVGGGDVRFQVGTRAFIAQAVELADGRWGLMVKGSNRIRVERWLPDDPYPRADVRDLPEDREALPAGAQGVQEEMVRRLRRVLALRAELGETAAPATVEVDGDPVLATWQAAALAPLGPADAQHVLELDDPWRRMELVVRLLGEDADVLARRVAAG